MTAVIQVKRGTASGWTAANPTLAAGEIGFETDTKKMKVGDGSTAWTSLGYTATDGDISSVVAGTGLSGGGTSGAVTLNLSTPVATTNGGTGLSSFTTGDLVYASGSNTLAARSIGSTGQVLTVSGGVPVWGTSAAAAATFVGCLAAGVTQTIPNTTYTAVTFTNSDVYDTDAFHNPSSNSSRITIPSGKAGYYLLYVNIPWEDANGSVRELRFYKNGAAMNQSYGYVYSNTNSLLGYYTMSIMTVVSAVANDYFETFVWQNSGGNKFIYGDSGAGNLPGLRFGCALLGV